MPDLVPWLLFIHLFGVMVGIGPTFVFGRIAAMGRVQRAGSITTRVTHALSTMLVIPLGLVVILSGFGLIWALDLDVMSRGWLMLSIVLQLGVFAYSTFVQNRDISRILRLLDALEPGSEAAPKVVAELGARRRRVGRAGIVMKSVTTVILFLMVVKPF